MTAPLPDNETERLMALRRSGLLDTDPEEGFDDITLLAAQICGVPIAAVSLVDEHRQWFKSIVGLDVRETPRDMAFCAHTILTHELLVVPDAEQDARFADNPLVTGDPHIRFYAGMPLTTPEGHPLGSLCVIDRIPGVLTSEQQAALRALARQAGAQIALKRQVAAQEHLITERAAAQSALREFAEQLHTTVEAMHEGLTFQDADGVIQVCNPAAERILGLTADQMMGRSSLDPRWRAIREDGSDFPGEEHPATVALHTGEAQRDVLLGIYQPEGELVWVSVNASPLFHEGETQPYAVVVTFSDVTERKQAEDARARLAAIVDSSTDAILGTTLDGTLVSWNRGAEHLYGYSAAEMIGNNAALLAGPGATSPVPDVIQRLRHGEEVPPMEVIRHRKDGVEVRVLLSFSPIRNAGGEMIGLAGIGRDVTAQTRATALLHRERQFLGALLESLREGIVACDATGTLSLFNGATRRLHGLPEQPLPSDQWAEHFDLFRPDGVTPLPTSEIPLLRAFRGEAVRDAEMVIAPRDGAPRTLLASGQAIHDTQGEKIGAVVAMHDVTERKEMEAALRESQRFAQSIADHSTSIIYVFDLETMTNIYSNRSVTEFLGYSAAHVQEQGGDLLSAMIHPDDLPHVVGHFDLFADKKDGEVVELEYRARHSDGEWRWIWSREIVFNRRADGAPCQILGNAQDVTERKRSEEAIRRSEEALRAVMEGAPIVLYATDAQGVVTLSEGAGLARLGFAPGEVVGRSVFEMYRDVPEIVYNLSRALAGESVSYETVLNGLCYRNDIRPQRDETGRVTGMIAVASDLTDRWQAEEALRRAEEKYRGIFENAIDGVFQSVPEGRFVSANPALARMLGYDSPEELIASLTDMSQQLYVDPSERERLLTLAREQGMVVGFEVRFRRKDGSVLWASMNARVVRDAATGQEHFEGSVEDISARRAAEEQARDYAVVLEVKMQELESANAELERLATTDGLTGLLNHRAFQERLGQEFRRAGRYSTPLSLLILDVDKFKQFNDTFGHPAGDMVLKAVAEVLRVGARETDVVARYGGEEFVVILPLTDAAGAHIVAERIRAAVETAAWNRRPVTVSIGVCTAALHIGDPAALIACADGALYQSKAEGRNRVTHGYGRALQSAVPAEDRVLLQS